MSFDKNLQQSLMDLKKTPLPTFVSILLKRMINILKGFGAEHSVVHVRNHLWYGLVQRHGVIGE